jgi:hypothetical protein
VALWVLRPTGRCRRRVQPRSPRTTGLRAMVDRYDSAAVIITRAGGLGESTKARGEAVRLALSSTGSESDAKPLNGRRVNTTAA